MERRASTTEKPEALFYITVKGAKDLPALDVNGKSDPFCVIKFATKEEKTKIIKKELNPVWNQSFKFLVRPSQVNELVKFHLYDWDALRNNDYIGETELNLKDYTPGLTYDSQLPIRLEKKGTSVPRGSLFVQFVLLKKEDLNRRFWTAAINSFDVDCSGTISQMELGAILDSFGGPTSDELQELFKKIDQNNDQQATLDEILQNSSLLFKKDPEWIWSFFMDQPSIDELDMVSHRPDDLSKKGYIYVIDRKTGQSVEEKIPPYIRMSLTLMYSTSSGRFAVDGLKIKKVLTTLTKRQGKKYDNPDSIKEIEPFIQFHSLNREEILEPLENFFQLQSVLL
eukprot:TRINITY_DN2081_c0_g1_i1.p1 TRINITY_DN2081_c0_g1~~TRINITY_DN2081_c0_g1_i1.p1  ORF type:complete len:340 (-),score=74.71 TRINITY_DN2081_c0_g1_i1:750-1769(-)